MLPFVSITLNKETGSFTISSLNEENKVKRVVCDNEKYDADKVILATGGRSYPLTGSNGEGYKIAEKVGHTITQIYLGLLSQLLMINTHLT